MLHDTAQSFNPDIVFSPEYWQFPSVESPQPPISLSFRSLKLGKEAIRAAANVFGLGLLEVINEEILSEGGKPYQAAEGLVYDPRDNDLAQHSPINFPGAYLLMTYENLVHDREVYEAVSQFPYGIQMSRDNYQAHGKALLLATSRADVREPHFTSSSGRICYPQSGSTDVLYHRYAQLIVNAPNPHGTQSVPLSTRGIQYGESQPGIRRIDAFLNPNTLTPIGIIGETYTDGNAKASTIAQRITHVEILRHGSPAQERKRFFGRGVMRRRFAF